MDLPRWAQEIKLKYGAKLKDGELVIRVCPYCNNTHWNFQVSISLCVVHCWVCNKALSAKNFLIESDISFERDEIVPRKKEIKEQGDVVLPANVPLIHLQSPAGILAKTYLHVRGVTNEIIRDWKMGLGTGEDAEALKYNYFCHIIVPLYGLNGLEYFIAARFYDGRGYKLPPSTKDHFVPKRRGSDSLVIVEGLFDATTVWRYTTYDVMMLMGTYLMKHQGELLERVGYKTIYVCLDGDALDSILKLAWRLNRAGSNVRIIRLPKDKDPNDMREGLVEYINKSEVYTTTTSARVRMQRVREKGTV